jgi:hypothetical protein
MRFRFTIRDWFWLTLAVGLVIAWRLDHQRQAPLAAAANAVIDGIVSQDPQISYLERNLSQLRAIIPTNAAQSAEVQAKINQIENQLAVARAETRSKVAAQLLK